MKERKSKITIPCDRIAKSTYIAIARDLGLESEFSEHIRMLRSNDIKGFRSIPSKELGLVDPWRYKTYVQMQSLFKKYHFENDMYTDSELEDKTFDGYYQNQIRLAEKQLEQRPCWLQSVLGRARKILRRILGPITEVDIMNHAQFGKKASIGCPLASAYIDEKLSRGDAFTSTQFGFDWFKDVVLTSDKILLRLFSEKKILRPPVIIESLDLQLVPKAWNKKRPITPYTLIDLFRSFGIGRYAESRLKQNKLDLSRLPKIHQAIVKEQSTELFLATADLSAASDSLVLWILNAVLPRDWYRAVRSTTFSQMNWQERRFYTMSVLPMGNAATFPIETVVFYGIIKAVQELVGNRGRVSVFGDDLIYPVRLHKHLVRVFSALGFILNQDKTYAHYPFRESCGEDYYRGVAVRPALLRRSAGVNLSGHLLHSHIYKWVNVLLRRWSYSQISGTIDMLLQMIDQTGGDILRVPPQYPDQSGLKVEHPMLKLTRDVRYAPNTMRFSFGSRWWEFSFLALTYRDRVVKVQEPYYWLTLAGGSDAVYSGWSRRFEWMSEPPREKIRTTWRKRQPIRVKGKDGNVRTLKRKKKAVPVVKSRVLKEVVLRQSTLQEKSPFEAGFSDWGAGLLD